MMTSLWHHCGSVVRFSLGGFMGYLCISLLQFTRSCCLSQVLHCLRTHHFPPSLLPFLIHPMTSPLLPPPLQHTTYLNVMHTTVLHPLLLRPPVRKEYMICPQRWSMSFPWRTQHLLRAVLMLKIQYMMMWCTELKQCGLLFVHNIY